MFNPVNKILFYGVAYTSVRMLVGAISAVYLFAQGVGIFDIGMIKTFQAAMILVLDIPLAYFADQKSRKLSIILASLFSIFWLFTMGISETLGLFYLAEFFNSVSLALFGGAFISYLIDKNAEFDKSKQSIQKIIGKFYKYQHIGMTFFAIIGAFFITIDSSEIWFISCLLMILLVVISIPLLPNDSITSISQNKKNIFNNVFNIFKDIMCRAEIKWVVLILILTMVYYQSVIQFWQLIIGIDEKTIIQEGYIYGIIFAMILLIQSLSGYVVEKYSKKYIFYLVVFLTLMLFPYTWFAKIDYFYATSFTIIVLFFIIRTLIITLQATLHENITAEFRATYDSVISTIVRIILLIMLPSLGFMTDEFGFTPLYVLYLFIFFIFVGFRLLNTHLTKHSSGRLRRR